MSEVGAGCHELRINDGQMNWRLMYHVAPEAIVILDVFPKKTATTPNRVLADCRHRLAAFQKALVGKKKGARDARR